MCSVYNHVHILGRVLPNHFTHKRPGSSENPRQKQSPQHRLAIWVSIPAVSTKSCSAITAGPSRLPAAFVFSLQFLYKAPHGTEWGPAFPLFLAVLHSLLVIATTQLVFYMLVCPWPSATESRSLCWSNGGQC